MRRAQLKIGFEAPPPLAGNADIVKKLMNFDLGGVQSASIGALLIFQI